MANQARYNEIRKKMEVELRRGKFRTSMAKDFTIQALTCKMRFPQRYYSLNVSHILKVNSKSHGGPGIHNLIKCIGILEVYGKNLLKPDKPAQWRLIRKSNPKFKAEVSTVFESRTILDMLGYTMEIDDGLKYPDNLLGPDIPVVASVTTDLILLRQELVLLMKDQHPQDIKPWIPINDIIELQRIHQEMERTQAQPPNSQPPQYSSLGFNSPTQNFPQGPVSMPFMQSVPQNNPSSFGQIAPLQSMPYLNNNSRTYITPTQPGRDVPEQKWNGQSSEPTSNIQAPAAHVPVRGLGTAMQTKPSSVAMPPQSLIEVPKECLMCCEARAVYECTDCAEDIKYLCKSCFEVFHKNPKRKRHNKVLLKYETGASKPAISSQHLSSGEPPWTGPSTSGMVNHSNVNQINQSSSYISSQAIGPHNSELSTGATSLQSSMGSHRSVSLTASDWDQKVAELIDVPDPQRRKEKTDILFGDIEQKINNYNRIMEEIKLKSPNASSLFGHINEKIAELETIKTVVLTLSNEIDESIIEAENFDLQAADVAMELHGNDDNFLQIQGGTHSSFLSQANPSLNEARECDSQSSSILGKRKMEIEEQLSLTSQPTSDEHIELTRDTTTGKSFIPIDRDEEITTTKMLNEPQNAVMDISPIAEQPSQDQDFTVPPSGQFEFFQSPSSFFVPENTDLFPPMDLDPSSIQTMIEKEKTLLATTTMVDYLRSLRTQANGRFKPEHLSIAMTKVNVETGGDPILWLQQNWDGMVLTVQRKTIFPHVTVEHIEHELIKHGADIGKTIVVLNNSALKYAKKFPEFDEQEIISAVRDSAEGDKTQAIAILQRKEVGLLMQDVERTRHLSLKDYFVQMIYSNEPQSKNMLLRYLSRTFSNEYYAEMLKVFWKANCTVLSETITDNDVIVAIKNTGNPEDALEQLDKECQICTEHMPFTKITNLPTCGDNACAYCRDCLFEHLKYCMRDKNIRDTTCPVCGQPDIDDDDETATNHFNAIDQVLKRDKDLHELFQGKLRDFTLRKMPDFRWCSHCTAGFQFEPEHAENFKMVCPFCHKGTCYKCKKPWETQHEGISCENFKKWKEQNDPEFQAQGLAAHLKENGIDCPDCNFRYALAKGGCMHFKCTQCSHEFCCGCNSAFRKGKACTRFRSCATKGLHAHHPRDCLFYLRDRNAKDLQKLLDMHSIPYNTVDSNSDTCQVMEQKELPNGLADAICGKKVGGSNGGLCDLHYKEYLVNLVNTNHLDPAEIFDVDTLKTCLLRAEIEAPKRYNMSDQQYKAILLAEVKKLPLCHQR